MHSEETEGTSQALPKLSSDDYVLRAITSDYWVDKKTGKIKPHAFRRRDADKKGLSVFIESNYSIEQCISSADFTCHAVGRLQVGAVRELELDVIPDSLHHANINTSLPFPEEDDDRRNYLANRLAERCERVWP
ncbi:MAG: hypothetical protein L0229_27565 [Blastocatellia bacterium]|nr:hypothetical protein [Blastocatellia bacterium]